MVDAMPQDMGTDLTNLNKARSGFIQQLATLALTPRPDYSLDGQSVSPSAYMRFLLSQIDALDLIIQRTTGAFELQTVATPMGCGDGWAGTWGG